MRREKESWRERLHLPRESVNNREQNAGRHGSSGEVSVKMSDKLQETGGKAILVIN